MKVHLMFCCTEQHLINGNYFNVDHIFQLNLNCNVQNYYSLGNNHSWWSLMLRCRHYWKLRLLHLCTYIPRGENWTGNKIPFTLKLQSTSRSVYTSTVLPKTVFKPIRQPSRFVTLCTVQNVLFNNGTYIIIYNYIISHFIWSKHQFCAVCSFWWLVVCLMVYSVCYFVF